MRAQTSFEFLVLLSFMLMMFGGFFVVGEDLLLRNNQATIEAALIGLAQDLRDEILVANQVPAGYTRSFELPALVQEQQYELSVFGNELLIETDDDILFEYIIFLPFAVADSSGNDAIEIVLTQSNQIQHNTDVPHVRIDPQ